MNSNPAQERSISEVRDFIARYCGVYYADHRLKELAVKLQTIALKNGYASPNMYYVSLFTPDLDEQQIKSLVELLTVGETYFFREAEAIDVLGTIIIPALKEQGGGHLHIWCAGCATGEEPYSLAMYLSATMPEYDQWVTSLLATDINSKFLVKAREGVYTPWSFRTIPTHYKQRYFQKIDKDLYKLDKTIQSMVTFRSLNLAHDLFPSASNGTAEINVIFCRNVLMYFAPETIRAIVGRFARSLREGGWLIVSQTECSDYFEHDFDTVQSGGIFFYRKKVMQKKSEPSAQLPHAVNKPVHLNEKQYEISAKIAKTGKSSALHYTVNNQQHRRAVELSADEMFIEARCLADRGELEKACELCVQGISKNSLLLHGHYLHAAILQEAGRIEEARNSLRKVLYLDPDCIMAVYTLGIIDQKMGKQRAALRHFDTAARLLTACQDDDVLSEAEGITVSRLREFLDNARAK